MPSNKPRLATYTTDSIIKKFQYISDYEKRSASKELEYIVEEYIRNFESNHGQLIVGEDGNVLLAKPKEVKQGKSSNSKIG